MVIDSYSKKRVFKSKSALCVGTQPCAPLPGHVVGALTDTPAEAGEDFSAHSERLLSQRANTETGYTLLTEF